MNFGLAVKIGELPKWAMCKDLWLAMQVDFIIRIVLSLLVIAMLIMLITSKLKVSLLLIITFIFSIIAWSFLILYFLASSDIYNEYISKESIKILAPDDVSILGNTSFCIVEWNFLQLDLYMRTAYSLFISGVLIFLINSNNIKQLGRKTVYH